MSEDVVHSALIVRDAVAEDAAGVRGLVEEAYGAFQDHFPAAIWDAYRAELAAHPVDHEPGAVLVALRGSTLVGTVTFYAAGAANGHGWPEAFASFRLLAVAPAARGQGVARALVQACIDRAEVLRLAALGLHTAPFMTEAIALYETMGFSRDPTYDFAAHDVYGRGDDSATVPGWAYVLPLR